MKEYNIPTLIKPEELEDESPLKENLRFTKEFFLDFLLIVIKNPISFLIKSLFIVFTVIFLPYLIQDIKNISYLIPNLNNQTTENKVEFFVESKGYEISKLNINTRKGEANVITNEGELLIKDIYSENITFYKKLK